MVEQDETRHRVSGAPQKATKETSSVIRLPRERLGEAPGLVARCFHARSNFVDLFQEERARSHALPHMFARGVLPLTRRSALKARRSLPGKPAGSRVGSTVFPAGGADGIVSEQSCSGGPQMTMCSEIGIDDGWLHEA
jgi:hypothetical protein